MTDGVIAGTGNSRYLKSVSNFLTLYPTYADFVAALVAGTLPFDLNGINAANWTQVGTPLSKVNLLSDATETELWGDADDRTVNQALSKLKSDIDGAELLYNKIRDITDTNAVGGVALSMADLDWDEYREYKLIFEVAKSGSAENVFFRINNVSANYAVSQFSAGGSLTSTTTGTSLIPGYNGLDATYFAKCEFRLILNGDVHSIWNAVSRQAAAMYTGVSKIGQAGISTFDIRPETAGNTIYIRNASLWGARL